MRWRMTPHGSLSLTLLFASSHLPTLLNLLPLVLLLLCWIRTQAFHLVSLLCLIWPLLCTPPNHHVHCSPDDLSEVWPCHLFGRGVRPALTMALYQLPLSPFLSRAVHHSTWFTPLYTLLLLPGLPLCLLLHLAALGGVLHHYHEAKWGGGQVSQAPWYAAFMSSRY